MTGPEVRTIKRTINANCNDHHNVCEERPDIGSHRPDGNGINIMLGFGPSWR